MKSSLNGSQNGHSSPKRQRMIVNALEAQLSTLKEQWRQIANQNSQMITNEFLFSRSEFGAQTVDTKNRDLEKEFGYVQFPSIETFKWLWERNAVARRAIEVYPDECWATYPEAYEKETKTLTRFESTWRDFEESNNPWHYLHRVDSLSRIGRFGGLLIGFDDDRGMDQIVPGIDEADRKIPGENQERKVLYMRTFDESLITIKTVNENPKNPRYQMPQLYDIQLMDESSSGLQGGKFNRKKAKTLTVHWSRFLHVADQRSTNELFGTEILRPILNEITDLRKVKGASAEMYFQGAFPGISFETLPQLVEEGEIDVDKVESLKKQISMYQNRIRRYLLLEGMTAKPMLPSVADPSNVIIRNLEIICLALGCPIRVFMGTEAAHLASTQDKATWNGRLRKRQKLYLQPMVITPFLDRLVKTNVIKGPARERGWRIDWADLNTSTDLDRANVILKLTQSLMQYVSGGCETAVPLERFLTLFMKLTPDEVKSIMEAPKTTLTKDVWKKPEKVAPQGGGRTGSKTGSGGRPAGRTPSSAS